MSATPRTGPPTEPATPTGGTRPTPMPRPAARTCPGERITTTPPPPGAPTVRPPGPPGCRWCPLCRAAHLLHETHPEVRVHLLSAARSLLRATALVLEQLPHETPDGPTARPHAARDPRDPRGPRASGVEHIDLDDDGPAGPGATSGPRGHDEEHW